MRDDWIFFLCFVCAVLLFAVLFAAAIIDGGAR